MTFHHSRLVLLALCAALFSLPARADDLRSPYLEARGFWSSQAAPLEATASLTDDLAGLIVVVSDPAQMAARVRLRVRLLGDASFSEVVRPPDARTLFPLGRLRQMR